MDNRKSPTVSDVKDLNRRVHELETKVARLVGIGTGVAALAALLEALR